ncbi:MAG: hypothetical protein ACK4GL_07010 [Flavobacteriales bacterium]
MKQVYDSLAQFNIVKGEKEFTYDYGMQCYLYAIISKNEEDWQKSR